MQFVADEGQVAHPGYLPVPADGVHDPEAFDLRHPAPGLEEAFDTD